MDKFEKDKDINYLNEKFPKGDKRRGEAMVLLALARIEAKPYIQHDKEVDILDIWFKKQAKHCLELHNVNMVIDFDEKTNIVGLEIFDFGYDMMEGIRQNNKIFDLENYLKEMKLNYKLQYPQEEFDKDFVVPIIFDRSF